MKKVKLFTHTDLDGGGCAIVAITRFGKENVDVTYCDYHDVNQKINEFVFSDEIGHFDQIFITDISVSEQVAGGLDMLHSEGLIDIQLLDHHETAEWLNEYEWATVSPVHEDGTSSSGTSMLWDFLGGPGDILDFVEKVRRYDTWEWVKVYNDRTAKQLNDLFYIYGRDKFVESAYERISDKGTFYFTETEELLNKLNEEEIERYLNKCRKLMTTEMIGKYKVGVVFAEQFPNDVAHTLHQENPELDLIAIVNMSSKKVSFRTERDDVNVGQFAKYFGGGGREQTAGAELDLAQFNQIKNIIFNQ
jgi:uncharacterized protein